MHSVRIILVFLQGFYIRVLFLIGQHAERIMAKCLLVIEIQYVVVALYTVLKAHSFLTFEDRFTRTN